MVLSAPTTPTLSFRDVEVSAQNSKDLRGHLQQAETRVEELAESLKRASSSMEQCGVIAQSQEESLNKEKQETEQVCSSCEACVKQGSTL